MLGILLWKAHIPLFVKNFYIFHGTQNITLHSILSHLNCLTYLQSISSTSIRNLSSTIFLLVLTDTYPLSVYWCSTCISLTCARRVPDVCQTCTYQTCARCVPDVYQACTRRVPDVWQTCTRRVPDVYQTPWSSDPPWLKHPNKYDSVLLEYKAASLVDRSYFNIQRSSTILHSRIYHPAWFIFVVSVLR